MFASEGKAEIAYASICAGAFHLLSCSD